VQLHDIVLLCASPPPPDVQLLQAHYRITRDKTIQDGVIYLLHFVLLLIVCLNRFDVHGSFAANDGIRVMLTQREMVNNTWRKTYGDIGNMDEIAEYFTPPTFNKSVTPPQVIGAPGPFFEALFPTSWYDGMPMVLTETPYIINGNHRLIGAVHLRFVFVQPNSCTAPEGLPSVNNVCWGAFSLESQFTGSKRIGDHVYNCGAEQPGRMRGRYSGVRMVREIDYGTKGFGVSLPAGDVFTAASIMEQLQGDSIFHDPGLRGILATFNTYNTNTRYMSVARLVIEITETAQVLPSTTFFTVPTVEQVRFAVDAGAGGEELRRAIASPPRPPRTNAPVAACSGSTRPRTSSWRS